MKRALQCVAALLLGLAFPGAPAAEEAPAQAPQQAASPPNNAAPMAGTNFTSFSIIAERNIFNQSRGPRSARRSTEPARRAPAVQSLALVGSMSFGKGDFAFFDGSRPEYKKPVKTGEKIAGYEVRQITPSSVKIANETQEFELKVGQRLSREDEGEWKLGGPVGTASSASASPAESPDAPVTSSGANSSEEEALRRLMEKRAKELE